MMVPVMFYHLELPAGFESKAGAERPSQTKPPLLVKTPLLALLNFAVLLIPMNIQELT